MQGLKNIWLPKVLQKKKEGTKLMLLGNKADLNDKNEELRTEAEQLAKEHNMIFMEVSAKTG